MPCTHRAQTADFEAYSGESPSPFLSFLSFLPSFLGGIPARVPISQARRQAVDGADLWCSTLWTCLRQCLNGAAAAAGKLTGNRYVLPVTISLLLDYVFMAEQGLKTPTDIPSNVSNGTGTLRWRCRQLAAAEHLNRSATIQKRDQSILRPTGCCLAQLLRSF